MKIILTQLYSLLFCSFISVASQANILIEGIWQTSIKDQGENKRLVVTIKRDKNFKLIAFMDSPDDGWMEIPASITVDSNHVLLNFSTIGAKLEGVLKSGGKIIDAKFTWSDRVSKVKLKRIKKAPRVSPSAYSSRPVNEELAQYISSIDAIDNEKSTRLIKISNQLPFLNSLLVYEKGYLVTEHYFNDLDENYVANIKSVSKSIISMLVGIALEKKYLNSLDDKVVDILPGYVTPKMDSRLKDITVRHLLSMRAGFNYNEMAFYLEGQNPIWDSQDTVKAILALPLNYSPGERYAYSTPQTHLLTAILAKVTKMDVLDFANQFLFHPLNIKGVTWRKFPDGTYMGGSDMFMTPREMLQIGTLYLNGGQFKGKQIVSKKWIKQSIKGDHPLSKISSKDTYGYLWKKWTLNGVKAYRAAGFGGQYIINIPSLSVTIVTTANPRNLSGNDNNSDEIMRMITSFVLQEIERN
ncbi:MAG: beta-lactamase family protein [Colwellia sp.]|nr:beta-lactamase family protein [Colwellia sp.]